ncbi:MAG: sugar phosphate nucleotidyltransferase [Halobacteriales archaeon]
MKTVILAAGEGRRLEPLTDVRPKPMLPVANKPLLEYVVEAAVEAGVEELVLVVGYKRERIQSHFEDGDDWGVDIEYVVQEKQLGTGHAILQAEAAIDEPFLALNGDRILEAGVIEGMIDAEPGCEALMAVTRSDQPSDYGVVEVEGDVVRSIAEKPPRSVAASDIINAGVYRFETDVFDVLRSTETQGELTVTAAMQEYAAEERLRAVRYEGFWLDVSYLWDYLEVNAEITDRMDNASGDRTTVNGSSYVADAVSIGSDATIQPNATVLSGTAIGANVRVGPNVILSNTIVLPDATIHGGAVLQDCIVGANASVGPNTTVEGGTTTAYADGVAHEGVRLGGVIGDNATVGGNVTLLPAASIGTRSTVESGSVVDGTIPSNADMRRG